MWHGCRDRGNAGNEYACPGQRQAQPKFCRSPNHRNWLRTGAQAAFDKRVGSRRIDLLLGGTNAILQLLQQRAELGFDLGLQAGLGVCPAVEVVGMSELPLQHGRENSRAGQPFATGGEAAAFRCGGKTWPDQDGGEDSLHWVNGNLYNSYACPAPTYCFAPELNCAAMARRARIWIPCRSA